MFTAISQMSSEVYHQNESKGEHRFVSNTGWHGVAVAAKVGPPPSPTTEGGFAKSIMGREWPCRNTALPPDARLMNVI